MVFPRETESVLAAVAALINTDGGSPTNGEEQLPDVASLRRLPDRWTCEATRQDGPAELRAVRALRSPLRTIWELDETGVVATVNGLLSDFRATPLLVKHSELDFQLHGFTPDTSLAARIGVQAAMAMVDVVRSHELDRLKICASVTCRAVLVDLSRNRSKRFCDVSCSNRTAAAAYRARRSR